MSFFLKRICGIKLAYISYLLFITEMSFKLQFTRCLSDMSLGIIRATSFVQSLITIMLGSPVIIHNTLFWKIWILLKCVLVAYPQADVVYVSADS